MVKANCTTHVFGAHTSFCFCQNVEVFEADISPESRILRFLHDLTTCDVTRTDNDFRSRSSTPLS